MERNGGEGDEGEREGEEEQVGNGEANRRHADGVDGDSREVRGPGETEGRGEAPAAGRSGRVAEGDERVEGVGHRDDTTPSPTATVTRQAVVCCGGEDAADARPTGAVDIGLQEGGATQHSTCLVKAGTGQDCRTQGVGVGGEQVGAGKRGQPVEGADQDHTEPARSQQQNQQLKDR